LTCEDGQVGFLQAPALTTDEVAAITEQVRQRVLRWFARSGLLEPEEARDMRGWAHGGFSLDAAVRIAGRDRAGLERLLRDCARPPFALERLEQILLAPGEPPRPPPISPARGPPPWDEAPEPVPDWDHVSQLELEPEPRPSRRLGFPIRLSVKPSPSGP
jgi:hypothetical protein